MKRLLQCCWWVNCTGQLQEEDDIPKVVVTHDVWYTRLTDLVTSLVFNDVEWGDTFDLVCQGEPRHHRCCSLVWMKEVMSHVFSSYSCWGPWRWFVDIITILDFLVGKQIWLLRSLVYIVMNMILQCSWWVNYTINYSRRSRWILSSDHDSVYWLDCSNE